MFQWKETHLRYDGEVFAEEGERADSLYAWGPWFIWIFMGFQLKVSALAKGLANMMEWKAEVVLEGTLACYQSLGAEKGSIRTDHFAIGFRLQTIHVTFTV